MRKKPLLYVLTLGCPKNQVDSRQVIGMLKEEGYDFTDLPQAAEIIILNTCGFVDEAKEESIRAILDLAQYKKTGCCRFLAVMGCLVQKYGDELVGAIPEVDCFLGLADYPALLPLLREVIPGKAAKRLETKGLMDNRLVVSPPENLCFTHRWTYVDVEAPAGYVKIAEGCDHHCTFCAIPQIRGKYRSRRPEEILAEVKTRVAKGLREAILIAQDTGCYGLDLLPQTDLAALIAMLCALQDLQRIRIMYCYPEGVNPRLLAAMAHPKVCAYLDMPIQHIDDGLLRKMARPISSEKLRQVICALREIPGMVIRSTMMVGFPGETPEAFSAMLAFLEEVRLERVGFFAFSPQPGTAAAAYGQQVPEEEKERRLELAQSVQSRILKEKEGELVGTTIHVLVEEETEKQGEMWQYEGRSFRDAPEIDSMVAFGARKPVAIGEIVPVTVTHSQDFMILGEMADEPGK